MSARLPLRLPDGSDGGTFRYSYLRLRTGAGFAVERDGVGWCVNVGIAPDGTWYLIDGGKLDQAALMRGDWAVMPGDMGLLAVEGTENKPGARGGKNKRLVLIYHLKEGAKLKIMRNSEKGLTKEF